MKEEDLQILIMDWVRLHWFSPLTFHVANERKCNYYRGVKLKRMGVTPGVCDIVCLYPSNGLHGLLIELKVGKGRLTNSQSKFIKNARENGYRVDVCRDFYEARDVFKSYFKKINEVPECGENK